MPIRNYTAPSSIVLRSNKLNPFLLEPQETGMTKMIMLGTQEIVDGIIADVALPQCRNDVLFAAANHLTTCSSRWLSGPKSLPATATKCLPACRLEARKRTIKDEPQQLPDQWFQDHRR